MYIRNNLPFTPVWLELFHSLIFFGKSYMMLCFLYTLVYIHPNTVIITENTPATISIGDQSKVHYESSKDFIETEIGSAIPSGQRFTLKSPRAEPLESGQFFAERKNLCKETRVDG